MSMGDFYKGQDNDILTFKELRDKAWAEMKQRHEQIIEAFQGKDNLPQDQKKQIAKEQLTYREDWSIPDGNKFKAMQTKHQRDFRAITRGLLPESKADKPVSPYIESLAITRVVKEQNARRIKNPEKFKAFDQNKKQMDLDRDI